MKKEIYNILFIIVFVVVIYVLVMSNDFYPIDTFITDRLYSRLDGCDSNIIIVGINEETLSEYGILDYSYTDSLGNETPFCTEEERECLSIVKGTLKAEERKIMESHVVITGRILEKVHFNKYFGKSPVLAIQHHKCLNGKGYPNGMGAEELSTDARIIAVADICDAFLADDRPYKRPLPREKAFDIMRNMAKDGNIDAKLVEYLYECAMPENG